MAKPKNDDPKTRVYPVTCTFFFEIPDAVPAGLAQKALAALMRTLMGAMIQFPLPLPDTSMVAAGLDSLDDPIDGKTFRDEAKAALKSGSVNISLVGGPDEAEGPGPDDKIN